MKKKEKQRRAEIRDASRFMTALLGGLSGYTGAEVFLRSQPHPWHWLTALIVAVSAYGGLALWQRIRTLNK